MANDDSAARTTAAQRRLATAGAAPPPAVRSDPLRHARRAMAQLGREERFAHLKRMHD